MRFLLTAKLPTEAGNKALEEGTMGARIQAVLAALKPEAAYFYEDEGVRTAMMVVNMTEASEIPALAEPFFLGMNARVTLRPVMVVEDMAKAGLPQIAQTWGSGRSWK